MTKRKPVQAKRATPQPAAARKPAKPRRRLADRLPAWTPYALLFILGWIFCSAIYGPMFERASRMSFFAFDETLMRFLTDKPGGYLLALGRWMLLLFKYPWAGGLLLSLMLTATVALLDYALRLPARWRWTTQLLPAAVLAYLVGLGLNLFFKGEPGLTFLLPALALLIGVMAALVRFAVGRKGATPAVRSLTASVSPVLLFAALTAYALCGRTNELAIARMQNLMDHEDWDGMIDTAQGVDRPARGVAAYYAIALVQTDQLLDKLFDIYYQYPRLDVDYFDTEKSAEYDYYVPDCSLYGGLVNTAYHHTMEQMVHDGPSLAHLERMVKCAVINKEPALARKYLHILSKVPFEQAYVDKYAPMAADAKRVAADPVLARIGQLIPVRNTFEQNFQSPVFIDYYVNIMQGRSMQALTLSYAACLYTKKMPNLLMRTDAMRNQSLPAAVEQAVALEGLKNERLLRHYPRLNPLNVERTKAFLETMQYYYQGDRLQAYDKLKENWAGFYPLYYFLENIPDDKLKPQHEGYQAEKGGVN